MRVKILKTNKPWYDTIRHLCNELHYRQVDLAKDVGCSQACLSNYLNGKSGAKDTTLVKRIIHSAIKHQFK